MESVNKTYEPKSSENRISEIINESDSSFPDTNVIPPRSSLTYSNGYYVNCSAIFIDIRNSSELTQKYKRPVLSKIYRSFISEMVATLSDCSLCSEINIAGDCVWGAFNTPYKDNINVVFSTASKICSVMKIINYKFTKWGVQEISYGVGISYGRALMIMAGYNGSGIKDVVYMGDVVNEASKLCGYGNKSFMDQTVMLSDAIYENINDYNKGLCNKNHPRGCYQANIFNVGLDEWYNQNCK